VRDTVPEGLALQLQEADLDSTPVQEAQGEAEPEAHTVAELLPRAALPVRLPEAVVLALPKALGLLQPELLPVTVAGREEGEAARD
jgi:hypothetical protein